MSAWQIRGACALGAYLLVLGFLGGMLASALLVEHIRLAQKDGLDYMTNTSYEEPPFPQGYWPGKSTRAVSVHWRRSLEQFHADLEAVIELVRDPTRDLFVTVPNSTGKHTFFRSCLVIADHNSYHIGELAIGRQVA